MNEVEMKVFLEISINYFEKVTGQKAEVGSGVIQFGKLELLDFAGVIRVSGSSEGVVCLSMSRAMINDLLYASGEIIPSEELLRDMVGEAASVIASNARKYFGPRFFIGVPQTLTAKETSLLAMPFSRLALPINWRDHHAWLILALADPAGALSAKSA